MEPQHVRRLVFRLDENRSNHSVVILLEHHSLGLGDDVCEVLPVTRREKQLDPASVRGLRTED